MGLTIVKFFQIKEMEMKLNREDPNSSKLIIMVRILITSFMYMSFNDYYHLVGLKKHEIIDDS